MPQDPNISESNGRRFQSALPLFEAEIHSPEKQLLSANPYVGGAHEKTEKCKVGTSDSSRSCKDDSRLDEVAAHGQVRHHAVANKSLPDIAHARNSDPETSHKAAASVVNLGRTRDAILSILRYHGSLTDEQIWDVYEARRINSPAPLNRVSQSGLRSRRSELVDMGFVVDSGQRAKTASGRDSIVWQVAK